MKKITLTLFLLFIISSIVFSQRTLEIITAPEPHHFHEVADDSFAYFTTDGSMFYRYDGTATQSFMFPMRDDVQTNYNLLYNELLIYKSSVYVTLLAYGEFLYRFDGTSFLPIDFPGPIASNVVIYRERIYAMIRTETGSRLYSFDGTTIREVPSSSVTSIKCRLSAGSFLYIQGSVEAPVIGYAAFLKKYDGATIEDITVPALMGTIRTFHQLASNKVYFVCDAAINEEIYYYNGSTLTEVYHGAEGSQIVSPVLFRRSLYFTTRSVPFPPVLMKCSETGSSEVAIPSSLTLLGLTNMAVFRDNLYLPLSTASEENIYLYNGSAFIEFFTPPDGINGVSIKVRQGMLSILARPGTDDVAYEYDGVSFTEIRAPGGEQIFQAEESSECFHVWMLGYFDKKALEQKFVLAVEKPDAICTPPDEESVIIIPREISGYEHFVLEGPAFLRDWCWSGIDIDWEGQPCVYPCEEPKFTSTLKDKNGKIAWQKTFSEPFSASIPLADTQPYELSLAVEKNNTPNNVLVFDKDLVNKGVESIVIDLYPKDEYIYLTVTTDKNVKIPFTMSLKNTQGQSLWEGKYTAPMDQLIREFVSKAGDYLQFSLQQAAVSGVTYYPNPSTGKFTIDVNNDNQAVSVSVSDFNGQIIYKMDNLRQGENTFEVPGQKAGLYVLTIVEGKSIRKELISVK